MTWLSRWRREREPLSPAVGYGRWAARYDREPNRAFAMERTARRLLPCAVAGRRWIDLGCGTGRVSGELLDEGARSVLGVDASREMLSRVPARARVDLLHADLGALPLDRLRTARLDAACGVLVWAHLAPEARGRLLVSLAHALPAGAPLVLSCFHPAALAAGMKTTFGRGRGAREIRTWPWQLGGGLLEPARTAGFELVQQSEVGLPGAPLSFVALLLRRR